MTSTQTLAAEARHLRQVCRRQLPKIRSIVEAHPDQARRAFDVLHGSLDAVLCLLERHPGHAAPADAEHALSVMAAELRWLADVVAAGDSHATTCQN